MSALSTRASRAGLDSRAVITGIEQLALLDRLFRRGGRRGSVRRLLDDVRGSSRPDEILSSPIPRIGVSYPARFFIRTGAGGGVMGQVALVLRGNEVLRLELPDPDELLMHGVPWGQHTVLFTPAFWRIHAWQVCHSRSLRNYKLGNNLKEEVAACVLGGHGIPAEVGVAAFRRLRDRGLLEGAPPEHEIFRHLSEALEVGSRRVRYRFARQKSRFLSQALHHLREQSPPVESGRAFRAWLLNIPGIGPKTASWITRNWLDSDEVAIIDIHIHRAGILAGIFQAEQSISRHYFLMEELFLEFSRELGVPAAVLDDVIWSFMKGLRSDPRQLLSRDGPSKDQLPFAWQE